MSNWPPPHLEHVEKLKFDLIQTWFNIGTSIIQEPSFVDEVKVHIPRSKVI